MALSLSPGGDVTAHMLDQVATLATTARHAPDLHGEWYMVYPQMFQLAAKFHNRVPNASSPGLFLDLDILPFGAASDNIHIILGRGVSRYATPRAPWDALDFVPCLMGAD